MANLNFLIASLFFISFSNAMSLGAPTCDALGVCFNTNGKPGLCPPGMDKVAPPERNTQYTIRTGDAGVKDDPKTYVPGEIMDIHIRTNAYDGKFIGLLIYAVEYDEGGQYNEYGCPSPGCNGADEVKTGSWIVAPGEPFQTSQVCGDQALTHTSATLKNFHHALHWKAPSKGTGKVIFRALIKVGPTNQGWFYWPMAKDLVLEEDLSSTSSGLTWLHGAQGESCKTVCRAQNLNCDEASMSKKYDGFQSSFVCPKPFISSCGADVKASVWSDSEGDCFVPTESCKSVSPQCSAKISTGKRFCPCKEEGLKLSKTGGHNGKSTSSPTENIGLWMYPIGALLGCSFGVLIAYLFQCHKPSEQNEDVYMDMMSSTVESK